MHVPSGNNAHSFRPSQKLLPTGLVGVRFQHSFSDAFDDSFLKRGRNVTSRSYSTERQRIPSFEDKGSKAFHLPSPCHNITTSRTHVVEIVRSQISLLSKQNTTRPRIFICHHHPPQHNLLTNRLLMISSSSTKTTKCEQSTFYEPLLPADNVVHMIRHRHESPYVWMHQVPHVSISRTQSRILQRSDSNITPLADKLLGDVVIGTGVTFCVAPALTVIDKAVFQRAAGSHTLFTSGIETMGTILRAPLSYIKSPTFLLMWGVYAATFSCANSLKTITEHQDQVERIRRTTSISETPSAGSEHASPPSANTVMAVFMGTSVVNSAASLYKDRSYARMFGTSAATSLPKVTYGLWMARDFAVMGSSFILPDLVSEKMHSQYDMDPVKTKRIAQITIPAAMQLVAGPLQLLGLDFYNRPLQEMSMKQAILERGRFLRQGFTSVVSAKIARIAPVYSIGGCLNTDLREQWRGYLRLQNKPVVSSPLTLFSNFLHDYKIK